MISKNKQTKAPNRLRQLTVLQGHMHQGTIQMEGRKVGCHTVHYEQPYEGEAGIRGCRETYTTRRLAAPANVLPARATNPVPVASLDRNTSIGGRSGSNKCIILKISTSNRTSNHHNSIYSANVQVSKGIEGVEHVDQ
jgi:hypothetical protein